MSDQADKLRKLVQEATHDVRRERDVPIVAVCGGRRSAGASTVALQLALAWQREKRKPILVDASFRQPSFYAQARSRSCETLVDVVSGGRTVAEAIRPGPHGLAVLPGAALPPALEDISAKTWAKVIGQLRSLQSTADVVVFDIGAGAPLSHAPLWHAANYVLLVTGSEPLSVTDTYAALKTASLRMGLPTIGILVNQSTDEDASEVSAARIASAAGRFLQIEVQVLPAVPFAGELAGETAASSRLHKDAALRESFTATGQCVWTSIEEGVCRSRPTVAA